jgi:hypothetical protein
MIRQHNATGANTNGSSALGDKGNDNRGCSAGYASHVVVFRNPVSRVAPLLCVLGKIPRIAQRVCRRTTLGNRGQVEN